MDKKTVKIFSGSSNLPLAEKVAKNLKMNLGEMEITKFSDGEFQPVFKENIRGRTVFLIQSCYPPFDNWGELFMMCDLARRASAQRIIPIVSYFGYGRQDRKDKPRVGIASKLMADFLEKSGATRVVTLDLHSEQIGAFFNIPFDHLLSSYIFLPYIKNLKLENPVLCSPDVGSTKRNKFLANHLNCEMVICYKHRTVANKVDEMILIGDVKGKDVIISDDILDTGNTIISCTNLLLEKGANSVRTFITHPVMSGNSYENIQNSKLTELVVTDSIPLKQNIDKIKVVSCSDLLSRAIKNIVDNKSLSKLFI